MPIDVRAACRIAAERILPCNCGGPYREEIDDPNSPIWSEHDPECGCQSGLQGVVADEYAKLFAPLVEALELYSMGVQGAAARAALAELEKAAKGGTK